jgi:hypothetical protein
MTPDPTCPSCDPKRADLDAWQRGEVAWTKLPDLIHYIRHQDAEIQRITRERDDWRDANTTNIEIQKKFQRERDHALEQIERLKALLRALFPMAMDGFPKRSHEGACGPEAGCDADCMDVASCSELLREVRQALSPAAPERGE